MRIAGKHPMFLNIVISERNLLDLVRMAVRHNNDQMPQLQKLMMDGQTLTLSVERDVVHYDPITGAAIS